MSLPENEQTENQTIGETLSLGVDQIKPLEKRAINYIVNEYLLAQNYKLTSVTLSEENEDQVRTN